MQNNSNSAVLTALLAALRPIARILMKAGIGYREFSEIAKCAFVDVSTSDYGLRGRPTNISRVAVMTGLTRKEVKRLREKIKEGNQINTSKVVPPMEIIHQWHTDEDFLDESGRPKELTFDDGVQSFSGLVKRYGGDIPPGAMRTELIRVNAVEETDDGKLVVTRRHYVPHELDQVVQHGFGRAIFGLANAVDHNLKRYDKFDRNGEDSWIQRLAWTTRIRDADKVRVRRISRDRIEEFVTSIDDLFSAYETIYPETQSDVDADASSVVGVGVYYFEADAKDMTM